MAGSDIWFGRSIGQVAFARMARLSGPACSWPAIALLCTFAPPAHPGAVELDAPSGYSRSMEIGAARESQAGAVSCRISSRACHAPFLSIRSTRETPPFASRTTSVNRDSSSGLTPVA